MVGSHGKVDVVAKQGLAAKDVFSMDKKERAAYFASVHREIAMDDEEFSAFLRKRRMAAQAHGTRLIVEEDRTEVTGGVCHGIVR